MKSTVVSEVHMSFLLYLCFLMPICELQTQIGTEKSLIYRTQKPLICCFADLLVHGEHTFFLQLSVKTVKFKQSFLCIED